MKKKLIIVLVVLLANTSFSFDPISIGLSIINAVGGAAQAIGGWMDSAERKVKEITAWKDVQKTKESIDKVDKTINEINNYYIEAQKTLDTMEEMKNEISNLIQKGNYSGAYKKYRKFRRNIDRLERSGTGFVKYSITAIVQIETLYKSGETKKAYALINQINSYKNHEDQEKKISQLRAIHIAENKQKIAKADRLIIEVRKANIKGDALINLKKINTAYIDERKKESSKYTDRLESILAEINALKTEIIETIASLRDVREGFMSRVKEITDIINDFLREKVAGVITAAQKLLELPYRQEFVSSDNILKDISYTYQEFNLSLSMLGELRKYTYRTDIKSKPISYMKDVDMFYEVYGQTINNIANDWVRIGKLTKELKENDKRIIELQNEFNSLLIESRSKLEDIDAVYEGMIRRELNLYLGKKTKKSTDDKIKELEQVLRATGFMR